LHELIYPAEPPSASGKRPWVAVKGMGGIGKTHFVVNYAWTHREVYETICWVNATGKDIAAAVAGLANEPQKPPLHGKTLEIPERLVMLRWSRGKPQLKSIVIKEPKPKFSLVDLIHKISVPVVLSVAGTMITILTFFSMEGERRLILHPIRGGLFQNGKKFFKIH
jgi:hypothetical protein